MAIARPRHAGRNPLDHLGDRLLVDIGLDPQTFRRRSWAASLEQLARQFGPTRS